jgi:hypothetical protein
MLTFRDVEQCVAKGWKNNKNNKLHHDLRSSRNLPRRSLLPKFLKVSLYAQKFHFVKPTIKVPPSLSRISRKPKHTQQHYVQLSCSEIQTAWKLNAEGKERKSLSRFLRNVQLFKRRPQTLFEWNLSFLGIVSTNSQISTLRPPQPPVQWVLCLSRGSSDRGVALTTHPI